MPSEPAPNLSRQIVGLDLVRTAAAVMVVFFHLGYWIWTKASDPRAVMPAAYAPFTPVFSVGWVGVEIFFVISGFVIAYSTEGATPIRFGRHRVLRLVPAAVVCATATGAVLLVAYPVQTVAWQWARSVVFWPEGPWIDGTYWTLPIEVAFYLLVLLVLCWKRGLHLPVVMAGVGGLSAAANVIVVFLPQSAPAWLRLLLAETTRPPAGCCLVLYGCLFALGVFLFLALLHGATSFRIVMLVLLALGCTAEILGQSGFRMDRPRTLQECLPLLIWLAAVAFLVVSVRGNGRMHLALGVRGTRVVRQIGLATYPLYLLHDKLGQVAIGLLHRHVGYGPALCGAAGMVVSLAFFVTWVLEPPLRRGLGMLWPKSSQG